MKIAGIHIILLFFFGISLNAQNYTTKIEGRVYSKDGDVTATHVSNRTTNKGTITDDKGFFSISAKLNDTLVFSAVQYKRKELIVDLEMMETALLSVILEEALIELKEVVVMPYNLSGVLEKDMSKLQIGQIITASTENLTNSNLKPLTQTERQIFTATALDCNCTGSKLDPLFNYFSGRTKMLKDRAARDSKTKRLEEVRKFYKDSLYMKELKIPKRHIDAFVYYCELDSSFSTLITKKDKLKIWEFMKHQSIAYLKTNDLN